MAADFDNRITPTSEGKPDTAAGVKDDLDAFDAGGSEAESRGGDHRPIQSNGTQGHTSSVQGQMSGNKDFPQIPDNFAPPGTPDGASDEDNAEISDIGLNEKVEVGQHGNQLQYGIDGPAAGGGNKRNTVT